MRARAAFRIVIPQTAASLKKLSHRAVRFQIRRAREVAAIAATLDSDYAAGFYTNRSEHPYATGRVRLGFPRDSYFASGLLGQRIVILPSQHMVVVRLGDSIDPTGDIRGVARLVKEVIAATQP